MVQINKSDGCFENRFRVDAPDACASIAVAAQAASNWRMYMRRRKAPAGALPTELIVRVWNRRKAAFLVPSFLRISKRSLSVRFEKEEQASDTQFSRHLR